jgi:uncharacterized protein (DUF342 family)
MLGELKVNEPTIYQKGNRFVIANRNERTLDAEEIIREINNFKEKIDLLEEQLKACKKDLVALRRIEPIAKKIRSLELEQAKKDMQNGIRSTSETRRTC